MIGRVIGVVAAMAFSIGFMPGSSGAAGLDQYAWSHRPVVIFASAADDPRYVRQIANLETFTSELADRDMVVISVIADHTLVLFGPCDSFSSHDLRSRFAIPTDGFAVLLIGKDTGVKRRTDSPIQWQSLFSQIDGMPMRRREIR